MDPIEKLNNAAKRKINSQIVPSFLKTEIYEEESCCGEPIIFDEVSEAEKIAEDKLHEDRLAEIVASYTEEDAAIAMEILLKKHPKIVYNEIGKGYLKLMKRLDSISELLGGE